MGDLQGRVADFARLLTKNCAQKSFLRCQLGLTLGSDFSYKDVAGTDLSPDPDYAPFVEIGKDLLGEVRNVSGDLLSPELCVPGIDLVLLNMD